MKHYVIALRAAYALKHSYQLGEIVSMHENHYKANEKVNKLHKATNCYSGIGRAPDFGVLVRDEKTEKGTIYPALAEHWLTNKFDNDAVYVMKYVLDPDYQGGTIKDDTLSTWLGYLNLTLDQLREKYEARAKAEMDAEAQNKMQRAEESARIAAIRQDLVHERERERSQFTYAFPAVSGIQAGRAFYAAQVPYSALVKLFTFDDDVVPAHLRAQRVLNERRGEAISEYLVKNRWEYVLPALTASVSAEMVFQAVDVPGAAGRIGLLHVPMDATLLINDGQHRRRGIELALKTNPTLRDESVTVTFFYDQGLERSQQMFADINGNQIKPSSAINALYDRRNPFNAWALSILGLVPDLGTRIDVENSTVGAKSLKLWSLVAFKKFLSLLTGVTERNIGQVDPDMLGRFDVFLCRFFEECRNNISSWAPMMAGDICGYDVREQFVIGHAVWLEALAIFARQALFHGSREPHFTELGMILPELAQWSTLEALAKVDPRKTSTLWDGRCVVLGKMQKTSDGVKTTAAQLLIIAGIPLSPEMMSLEQRVAA